MKKYIIKATVFGERNKTITNKLYKRKAMATAKKLRKDMRIAIPKYRKAFTDIRIIKIK